MVHTRTLRPLFPLYISSVDSGNLAGHLLTLGAGLNELGSQDILFSQLCPGLGDTARILRQLTGHYPELKSFESNLASVPATLATAHVFLKSITGQAEKIASLFLTHQNEEVRWWSRALERECRAHLQDLLFLAPWLEFDLAALQKCLAPPPIQQTEPNAHNSDKSSGIRALISEKIDQLWHHITLREVSELNQSLYPLIEELLQTTPSESTMSRPGGASLAELNRCLQEASDRASQRLLDLDSLTRECQELADMDFTFLYDSSRELFAIGLNVAERRTDSSFYDLLASEARLCGYVAIAQGQIPQEHWFALGRLLVAPRGAPVLASWSGSMFEYLMPLLVMPNYLRLSWNRRAREPSSTKSITEPCAECPGAFPSPATIGPTST